MRKSALPIMSIYFLVHNLDPETAPLLKVNRQYIDLATGQQLKHKEKFIESLTHIGYGIQIPELKGKQRNKPEKVLSIIDQSQKESENILNINQGGANTALAISKVTLVRQYNANYFLAATYVDKNNSRQLFP